MWDEVFYYMYGLLKLNINMGIWPDFLPPIPLVFALWSVDFFITESWLVYTLSHTAEEARSRFPVICFNTWPISRSTSSPPRSRFRNEWCLTLRGDPRLAHGMTQRNPPRPAARGFLLWTPRVTRRSLEQFPRNKFTALRLFFRFLLARREAPQEIMRLFCLGLH